MRQTGAKNLKNSARIMSSKINCLETKVENIRK